MSFLTLNGKFFMNKIKQVSHVVIGLLTVYLVFVVVSYIWTWVAFGFPPTKLAGFGLGFRFHVVEVDVSTSLMDLPDFGHSPAPFYLKMAYIFESVLTLCAYIGIILCFIRLFCLYGQAIIFDPRCTRLFQCIGWLCAGVNLILLLCLPLELYVFGNPIVFELNSDRLLFLAIALLIIVISWVMKAGQVLQEEQKLTI